jgi:hypothetical protein
VLVLAPEAINDGARGSILIGRFDGQLVGHRGVRLTLLVVPAAWIAGNRHGHHLSPRSCTSSKNRAAPALVIPTST